MVLLETTSHIRKVPMAPITTLNSFESFGLSEQVMASMNEMGFTTPTPIQSQALPILLAGANDFIGLASTGTGKTAAFGIPLIEGIDSSKKDTQALVMSPTRELALQVAEQLTLLGKKKGVRVVTIYGGASYRTQIDGIKRGAHIVVATPGRLVDFLEQKMIKLQSVKTVVLDEADEMLSMGFKDALETILSATQPSDGPNSVRAACRTWLFSATMSSEVKRLTSTYLENPETVQVNKVGSTADTIDQVYYTVKNSYKTEVISRLLQTLPEFYGIIFCQTKMEVAELADILTQRGFPADSLHGDKSQAERESTLKKFKQKAVKVIVATDVAARGLDIKDLTHVVNHSLPWDSESYVHRIGRTGRNGQKGTAITLVNPEQLNLLRRVMQNTKATLTKGVIPSANEVAGLKIKDVMEKVSTMNEKSESLALANDLIENLIAAEDINLKELSKEELLARFIAAYFPQVFVKKDLMLDYMGDRVPRELLPRDPQDNRFSRGRSRSGGGGFDRGERSDRSGGSRFGGRSSDRRGPRNDDRGERADRGGDDFRPRRSFSEARGDNDNSQSRGFRSERSSERPSERFSSDRSERFSSDRSERSVRPERRGGDHPGIRRQRPSSGGASAPSRRNSPRD